MAARHTPDERFVISLYQTAKALGDISTHQNKYEVGRTVGINPKGVDAISKLLVQANFIKRATGDDDEMIYLTKNGEQLALRLLNESAT